jgi:hypothetical protein
MWTAMQPTSEPIDSISAESTAMPAHSFAAQVLTVAMAWSVLVLMTLTLVDRKGRA